MPSVELNDGRVDVFPRDLAIPLMPSLYGYRDGTFLVFAVVPMHRIQNLPRRNLRLLAGRPLVSCRHTPGPYHSGGLFPQPVYVIPLSPSSLATAASL